MSSFNAKMHQIRFRLGLRPRPRWGSLYSAPADILVESNMQGQLFRGWKKTRREKREQDAREGTGREKQSENPK